MKRTDYELSFQHYHYRLFRLISINCNACNPSSYSSVQIEECPLPSLREAVTAMGVSRSS